MQTEPKATGIERLSHVTLFVEDQQAALEWYVDTLGFENRDDEPFEMPDGATGRWLTMAPPGNDEVEIALVSPDPDLYEDEDIERIRSNLGTDPWWTFHTGDLDGTLEALEAKGVTVVGDVREMPWGRFAMVEDLDGNVVNLRQPAA